MAISLHAAAQDNDETGVASEFVSIAQPVGVLDGDLLLACITVHAAGAVITPVDSTWTLVARTDPAQPISMAVYWKTALSEPVRWVFGLSSAMDAEGVVAAYGGADGWEPVEADAVSLTPSGGSTVAVSATSASYFGEELALFIAAAGLVTFTPATGFNDVTDRQRTGASVNGSLSMHRRVLESPGTVPTFTVAMAGGTPAGASIIVALRPSPGLSVLADVVQWLIRALPRGADRVYDLTQTGDYYKLFTVFAQMLKVTALDLLDLMQLETRRRTAIYMLPDWEVALGLTTSWAARLGSITDRQTQVISSLRQVGGQGAGQTAMNAVIGPLLGYYATTPVQVMTCPRGDLDVAHSYSPPAPLTVAASADGNWYFRTVDGGKVSTAGARIFLEFVAGAGHITVLLTAPDNTVYAVELNFDSSTEALVELWGANLAGAVMQGGPWFFQVQNQTGGSITVNPTVIVEGMPIGYPAGDEAQATAGAIFYWGVYADPAHIGENGSAANLDAVRRAIMRFDFAHTHGNLIQSVAPYPGTNSGPHIALPGECIPCANA